MNIQQHLKSFTNSFNKYITKFMSGNEMKTPLYKAMKYGLLNGGKRIRPYIVCEFSKMLKIPKKSYQRLALAVELVHSYSLIHDDLPAMDDDDLRRGRLTVHKKFDEATAILAGDALLTESFAVLANPETHADSNVRIALVQELAHASGAAGMVGGQIIDLRAANLSLDDSGLRRLQNLKTGCIISCACRSGAVVGKAPTELVTALGDYGIALGLAFQIADDVLDVEGSSAETGKAIGKDEAAGKATFVSRLGLKGAKDYASSLVDEAIAHLAPFGAKAKLLKEAAIFVVERRN